MPKIRKVARKKVYRYELNRRKLRNKQNKVPKIECNQMKNAWDKGRSVKTNLADMGLVYDPNITLKIPSVMELLRPKDLESDELMSSSTALPDKHGVVDDLAKEASEPRQYQFRLPTNELQFVTYFMDKYGEDYKAMARDPKNDYQNTWKQIRAKINRFKSVPEQFNKFVDSRVGKTKT